MVRDFREKKNTQNCNSLGFRRKQNQNQTITNDWTLLYGMFVLVRFYGFPNYCRSMICRILEFLSSVKTAIKLAYLTSLTED